MLYGLPLFKNCLTVLSKNQIKKLKSLSSGKFRQKYNNFIAEGHKLATEIIISKAYPIEHIYALSEWSTANKDILKTIPQETITEIDSKSMSQISNLSTSSPVFILLKKPNLEVKKNLISNQFSFLLQGVQDPGNVGTIIRIADWFGIPNIISDYKTADLLHPKVVQSSMGSICNVNLMKGKKEQLLELIDEIPSYALSLQGQELDTNTFDRPGIIMLGSEGNGLSSPYISKAKKNILIPPSKSSKADSLNVAVTAGIIAHTIG